MFFVVSVANERNRICLKKISLEDKSLPSWVKEALLDICSRIDADEQAQVIEKRENELKKREQEIANREAEIEKREEEWSFILVRTDGMHLNNAKIINKGAESQLFVFKMLLKNKIDAVLNHKKVGLKWHQIADELGKEEEKTINEDQVRQIICRIRKNIIDKHGESVCDKVIQCTSEDGYFLGEKVALILR